ncbi:autotransporter assembly complex family protein [Mesobacterium sp. TK19101]|uniref:Autotransporter assembly complex family protein n=1 Tax=Mesobacterium hydrothermale TaxID=3111907 RepID=A0ABU6HHL7_9RHOB|nr:autotransporter assembly complex family protein [Mesobacterium sp. TK19101]MEC3860615.1 autotransporter assembly complex family protein [Mesobacterium sp. TK19101]
MRRLPLTASVVLTLSLSATNASAVDLQLSAPSLSGAARDAVSAVLLLTELESRKDRPDGQEVLAAAQADYVRVLGALYDRGYYGPTISIRLDGREAAEIAPLSPPNSVVRAVVTVDPGPRFTFGTARIGPLAPGSRPPEGFVGGQTAAATVLREAADQAIMDWRNASHAKAQVVDQQITARHSAARLDATIRIDAGPALRFGKMTVTGQTTVRPERVQAIAGLPEGRVFSPEALEDAAERLRRTGTFRAANLREGDTLQSDGNLPIEIEVVDSKPRRIGFGAELSSRQGLTLSAFWLHRNLLGGAERLRIDGEIRGIGGDTGGVDYTLGVLFDRPATFNARTDFYASAGIESLDEVAYKLDRVTLESGLVFRADRKRTFTGGIGYESARVNDAFGRRDYRLLSLPLAAEYDGRDNRLNPRTGWFGRVDLTPFAGLTGVDSGFQTKLDLRGYRGIGDRMTVAVRGQLGSVSGASTARSPSEMLFYSGGTGTVRGHGYQSLGVTLPSGKISGGRSFAGISAELRVNATDKLSVVGFYDQGYIGPETVPDGRTGNWQSGAGLGLRYDTGIGPIRLDVATPLTGGGKGVQIYIGIGQAF